MSSSISFMNGAEPARFELARPVKVYPLSKRAHSTTLPRFHGGKQRNYFSVSGVFGLRGLDLNSDIRLRRPALYQAELHADICRYYSTDGCSCLTESQSKTSISSLSEEYFRTSVWTRFIREMSLTGWSSSVERSFPRMYARAR